MTTQRLATPVWLALSLIASPVAAAPYSTADDFFNSTDYILGSALPTVLNFVDFILPAGSSFSLVGNALGTTIFATRIVLAGELNLSGPKFRFVSNDINLSGSLNFDSGFLEFSRTLDRATGDLNLTPSPTGLGPGLGRCSDSAGATISIGGSLGPSLSVGCTPTAILSFGGNLDLWASSSALTEGTLTFIQSSTPVLVILEPGVVTLVPLPAAGWLFVGALPLLRRRACSSGLPRKQPYSRRAPSGASEQLP